MFAILDDSLVFFYGFPSSKVGIFVECLTKCYNPEKGIFLPSELLPLGKKDKIRKKLLSFHQRLKDSLGRKRSDSQWRKFGKTTIERSKEHAQESGEPFFST